MLGKLMIDTAADPTLHAPAHVGNAVNLASILGKLDIAITVVMAIIIGHPAMSAAAHTDVSAVTTRTIPG